MKIINISTWYPDAVEHAYVNTDHMPYADMLAHFESRMFGSDQFWAENLRALGHDVRHVIANCDRLQAKWRAEEMGCRPASPSDTVIAQARAHNADVVLLQDVSFLSASELRWLSDRGTVVAAQVSCPMPSANRLALVDACFTSFPHYVERLEKHGVKRVEFLPLAFERTVTKRVFPLLPMPARHMDVSFVGGVGRDSHWRAGTDALEAVAKALGPDRFRWWGYGLDRLAPGSPLRACHQGEAWGRDMYEAYLRSKIVVNRHGEVAEGCGNSLRQYEATGCGALLLTDQAGQFASGSECLVYRDGHEAAAMIEFALSHPEELLRIAAAGQAATWERHTWAKRMDVVAPILAEEVEKKAAATGRRG